MAFTLGGVDEALEPDTVVGLAVDRDQTVHGVTSGLPVLSPAVNRGAGPWMSCGACPTASDQ